MSLWPVAVYLLSVSACAVCAWLLARSYFRVRDRLLFWSAACFALLGVNNVVLAANITATRQADLSVIANLATLFAVSFLLYGFIWEEE